MKKVFKMAVMVTGLSATAKAATVVKYTPNNNRVLLELNGNEVETINQAKAVTLSHRGKKVEGTVVGIKRQRALVDLSYPRPMRQGQVVQLFAQAAVTDEFGYPVEQGEEVSATQSMEFGLERQPISVAAGKLYAGFEKFEAAHALRSDSSHAWVRVTRPETKVKYSFPGADGTYKYEGLELEARGQHQLSNGVRVGARILKKDAKIKTDDDSLDDNKQVIGVFAAAAVNRSLGFGLELYQLTREIGEASGSVLRALPSVMLIYAESEVVASWQVPIREASEDGVASEPGYFKVAGRKAFSSSLDLIGEVRQNLFSGVDGGLKDTLGLTAGYHYELSRLLANFGRISYDQSAWGDESSFAHPEAIGGIELLSGLQYQLEPQHQIEGSVALAQGSASADGIDGKATKVSLEAGYGYKF